MAIFDKDHKPYAASPVVQALQILFNRSPRQLEILKGTERPEPRNTLVDSIENRLSQVFVGYADISQDRVMKYRDYDRMDLESTEAQTALDIYAEEASQVDGKTGRRIWITANDPKVADELNGMLDRVKMEYKAYGIYRNIAKHGDCFNYLHTGVYGIHDTFYVHPSRIERVQDDGLLGFKSTDLASIVPMDNKLNMFKPWDFIHFRILAYDHESIYGRSILESLRKIWKQLSMLECYDDQTEILTKDGWTLFKDLKEGVEVATRNPETKEFEWQVPTKYVSRPHKGDMIELKGKSVDLLVTPNHRVLLNTLPKGPLEGPIENYANNEVVVRAEELVNNSNGVSIPKMSVWNSGIEIKEKVFPNIPNEVDHVRPEDSMGRPAQTLHFTTNGSQERVISGDDFCALMGMYLAEGCVNNKKRVPGRSGGIRIAQQKDSKGYEAYREVLNRINGGVDVPYDGHAFHLNWKALNPYFEQFGLAADKFIPEEILNSTKRQLKIFFDYFVLGDGYFEKDVVINGPYKGERRVSVTTISKRLATHLTEVIQKLGYGVSLYTTKPRQVQFKGKAQTSTCKEAYTLRLTYSPDNFFTAKTVQYDGKVYCVHVPNKFVYVRRNGKMAFSGQTMIVLYRIAKSVQRNIFYVDVGQASGPETTQIIKEYEKFLKNKTSFVDPKTKEFRLDFNPATMLQDIVWPTRSGSSSKVEYLQNTNQIGPLEDLDYFRNKLRSGLGIPKDYFDGEPSGSWNAREALMLQDVRFSRKIKKLQDAMHEGIVRLCQVHWAITHGEYLDVNQFQVNMGTISDVSDRDKEIIVIRKGQALMLLAAVADSMGWNKQVWSDYLLDQIFPLPPELRDKLYTPDPSVLLASMEGADAAALLQKFGGGNADGVKDLASNSNKSSNSKYISRRGRGSFMAPGGNILPMESTVPTLSAKDFTLLVESVNEIKEKAEKTRATTNWEEFHKLGYPKTQE
jgi:hypothetical protein